MRLRTGQKMQHLEAGIFVFIMLPSKPLFEIIHISGNGRNRRAHN
jgi:hypothetical protein